ncbi:nitrate- and nitrite sensing domain-containing protein [Streptomyces sp. NPDC006422]|uniref:nitrate- and nitrite sensing domain-containing protein n=1 Tax=unclassified Streptomyces TaxID=2593676 RepID=UPI0033B549A6
MDLVSSVTAFVTASSRPRTIRTRLLRILALATAVLLALLGFFAAEQISGYRSASATAADARLEVTLQGLVHELQKERGLTTGYVGGVRQFSAKLPAQRKATDAARVALQDAYEERGTSAAAHDALGRLDSLPGIRKSADDGSGQVKPTFEYFTRTIAELVGLGRGLDDVADGPLRDAYQSLQVLGRAKEFMGQERAIVLGSVRAGGHFRGDDYSTFMEIRAGRLAALDAFPRTATAAQERRLDAALATPDAERALSYESTAAHGAGRLGPRDVPPSAWWDTMTSTINGLRDVQVSIGADVEHRAAELEASAQRDLLLFGILALAVVAALAALAHDCVRSVSAPLTGLARQARELAEARLPRAVAAVQTSGDSAPEPPAPLTPDPRAGAEVREVAEAFDRVQNVAFDLATEQAVLRRNATDSLVSLGRRNQNLVRRQIGFINRLEHQDADPDTLANLFELDHLATRMRRNAESLLVLAGESSPRTWSTPLSVTDVLRASLSEVEEYRRVTLRRVEPAHISGSVVAELSHLLAELVENALTFSPPDADVEIEGRRTSEGYLVAIVDHGLGMDTKSLAEANVRLSGNASFMAEPTRFLGHFVVGALARKCGIEVRLGEAPAAGVVARVLVPAGLLTEAKATAGSPARPAVEPGHKSEEKSGRAPAEQAKVPVPRKEAPAPALSGAGTTSRTAHSGSASRTRNGLVKRPQRSAISKAAHESGPSTRPAPEAPAAERTPEGVSGMLSGLRSAHLRGSISVEKEREAREKAGAQQRTEAGDGAEGQGDTK